MSKYDGKWILSINNDDENWDAHGFYETKSIAIETGYIVAEENAIDYFKVGMCVGPSIDIDADEVIEQIQDDCYNNYGEISEGFLDNATTEQIHELEIELNKVYKEWIKKHNLDPDFFKIVDEEIIEL